MVSSLILNLILRFLIKTNLRNVLLFNLIYKIVLKVYIKLLCYKYDIKNYSLKFKRIHSYAGSITVNLIIISSIFIERAKWNEINNMIIHEIAHILDTRINGISKNPHRKEWKKLFIEMGGNGETDSPNYTYDDECYQYVCNNKSCKYYDNVVKMCLNYVKKRNCINCGSFCQIREY